jgi:uncharacterized protein (TIGR04255 family)
MTMTQSSPSFRNPPVVEVAIGLQFEPLGMASVHFGQFSKEVLDANWPFASDAPPVPDQVETFSERRFHWPKLAFRVQSAPFVSRVQFQNVDRDRMIQVQDTRFIYNWIRKNETYPRYAKIREEFDRLFSEFWEFTKRAKLATLQLNQWEVTYVNHVPPDGLWKTPADIPQIFPALVKSPEPYGNTAFESLVAEWRSEIAPQLGRLYINLQVQKIQSSDEPPADVLVATLAARGPVDQNQDWSTGIDRGHTTIVNSFADISSKMAKSTWGDEQDVRS